MFHFDNSVGNPSAPLIRRLIITAVAEGFSCLLFIIFTTLCSRQAFMIWHNMTTPLLPTPALQCTMTGLRLASRRSIDKWRQTDSISSKYATMKKHLVLVRLLLLLASKCQLEGWLNVVLLIVVQRISGFNSWSRKKTSYRSYTEKTLFNGVHRIIMITELC